MPEVRFKGFSGEWEVSKLGEIVKITMGQSPKGENYTKNPHDNILVQGNADIKNGWVMPRLWTTQITKMANKGDIILSVRAPVGDVGKTHYDVVIGRGVAAIKGNEFIYQLLLKMKADDVWKKFSTGSTFESINSTDIKEVIIRVPNELEQTQIGNFFKQLDETIAIQQQELDTLKQTKQGFLQKMFPKEGESMPEIRFDGFGGEWEERNFFDNINSVIDFRGRTPKKLGLDWSKSGYLALSALNVKNGYIDLNVDAYYGDEELYNKWMGDKKLKQGQVLFTTEAPMGNVAQVPDDKGYILSQRTIAFDVDDAKITNDFLSILLRSPIVINELYSMSSGGTAKGVSQKSLSKLKIVVPKSLEEQIQIGNFFKHLHRTIVLYEQEIDILKQTKKAFLQKMFV